MVCVISGSCDTKRKGRGQMGASTASLVNASDVKSVARLRGRRAEKLEAPAATLVAVPVCEAGTRGLTTPHRFQAYEGADMAQSTRTPGRSDSATYNSAVKITPASSVSATVTATPSVA
jgi:hypothetical protein